MGSMQLMVVYNSALFDYKDFTSPVRYFLEEPLSLSKLSIDRVQVADLFFQKATTEQYDGYFSYWIQSINNFARIIQVDRKSVPRSAESSLRAVVRLRLDKRLVIYGRVADTIFSALEQIGGF
jgi:hypothetical protein